MSLVHQDGPVGGLIGPSDNPLDIEGAPTLYGGPPPEEFYVTPVTTFQQQSDKNACVAHGASAPLESECRGRAIIAQVCRADIYSGALYLDNHAGRDVGVTIASMGRWITQKGCLSEFERPYGSDDVTIKTPSAFDEFRAKGVKAVGVPLVLPEIQIALMGSGGVFYGHEVRSNYTPDGGGVLPPPAGTMRGYHCTCWEGWRPGAFLMRQSWLNWGIDHPLASVDSRFKHLLGKRGYCWTPFEWLATVFEPTYFQGGLDVS